jgi:hypothetical protein
MLRTLELELIANPIVHALSYPNLRSATADYQSLRDGDGIAPKVIQELSLADDTPDNRAGIDADRHIQFRFEIAV